MQSRLLVVLAGGALLLFWIAVLFFFASTPEIAVATSLFVKTILVSLTFAALVWALRAGTPAAAAIGAVICCELTLLSAVAGSSVVRSGLTPLTVLFALTFAATRLGKRARHRESSSREDRQGRSAAQVIANLGAAPLALIAYRGSHHLSAFHWSSAPAGAIAGGLVLALAALVEATADTVSSELGQAFGGAPFLLTTGRRVAAGTDGAISFLGTGAGVLAGALVAGAGGWAMHLRGAHTLVALAGGIAGLLFDSLLGATAERRGWLNNDLVNFLSTLFAAAFALVLLLI